MRDFEILHRSQDWARGVAVMSIRRPVGKAIPAGLAVARTGHQIESNESWQKSRHTCSKWVSARGRRRGRWRGRRRPPRTRPYWPWRTSLIRERRGGWVETRPISGGRAASPYYPPPFALGSPFLPPRGFAGGSNRSPPAAAARLKIWPAMANR